MAKMTEKKMTKREENLWGMMKSQHGVLFLAGKPGIAKSATMKAVAEKNGYNYIDLRLADKDEVDISGMPEKIVRTIDLPTGKKDVSVMSYALPEWFLETYNGPTVVCFEELNRVSDGMQAAALGVLNERMINNIPVAPGTIFVATGNTGDDGCNVNEFDTAMLGRLIWHEYNMTIKEWVEGFANENVIPEIVEFIENHPSHYWKAANDGNTKAYASPRSWTNLSEYIKANAESIYDMMDKVMMNGHSYVGESITEFITFLRARQELTVKDILDHKKKIDFKKIQSANKMRLHGEIMKIFEKDLAEKFTEKELERLTEFYKNVHGDTMAALLNVIISNTNVEFDEDITPKTFKWIKQDCFKEARQAMIKASKENKNN